MSIKTKTINQRYDALAKLDMPELKEWQDARARIKADLPYEKERKT